MNNKRQVVLQKRSAAFKDMVLVIILGIPLLIFSSVFHLFERFSEFHQKYGVGPIDDFIIVFAVLAIVFAIFSLRRWRELQKALASIKILQGLLPICASCKKIRDDKGYWKQLEVYIRDHSEADFSHGICPECVEKLYGFTLPTGGGDRWLVSEGIKL
jgi:hypothetical protein